MISDFQPFDCDFGPHAPELRRLTEEMRSTFCRGKTKGATYEQLLAKLPPIIPSYTALDQDRVCIGREADLTPAQRQTLKAILTGLKPWRKGPFNIFGTSIDSEWDSALKWHRVAPHLTSLQERKILDVGSSCGYYLLRMAPARPRLLLGIEPYTTFYYQFQLLQYYLKLPHLYCLPLGIEDLPLMPGWFDTIFCMGIVYHRRSPIDTLVLLKQLLAKGGELVLETLVMPGDDETALFPRQRYACMRNVYFIPTVACLENWLVRSGFDHIRCVSTAHTTLHEQRKTQWIDSDSLDTFLDPQNPQVTKEGYPAPLRAVVLAHAD